MHPDLVLLVHVLLHREDPHGLIDALHELGNGVEDFALQQVSKYVKPKHGNFLVVQRLKVETPQKVVVAFAEDIAKKLVDSEIVRNLLVDTSPPSAENTEVLHSPAIAEV